MTEITANSNRLSHLMFNPFRFVAGFQALLMGMVIILISGFVGSFSGTHFDGVLDVHTGAKALIWFFPAEGVINWIYMVIPLFFFGLIMSRSSFRIIDVLGTQALARWPYFVVAIVMLPDANRRVIDCIMSKLTQTAPAAAINYIDMFVFGLAMILTIFMVIWMVALMYRAYAVSCNVKGAVAVVTFIVGLIVAEVLSKFAILMLGRAFSVSPVFQNL
jgi:hypothetical protein